MAQVKCRWNTEDSLVEQGIIAFGTSGEFVIVVKKLHLRAAIETDVLSFARPFTFSWHHSPPS